MNYGIALVIFYFLSVVSCMIATNDENQYGFLVNLVFALCWPFMIIGKAYHKAINTPLDE